MTRILVIIFLFTLTLLGQARAEIIEVKNMAAVANLIDQDSLVVFDIDNTLIQPVQSLGSDPWFSYTLKTSIDNARQRN